MKTDSPFSYRAGLTHLRALSVVMVLLFHAGVVESGYLGVDVFFVLSGFLISNILWESLRTETGSRRVLARFYARRCLRILPLSLFVIAVSAVASHLFFKTLIDDWVTAARAATVWAENWFLIRQSNDYFASQGTNPFQHYWSLAVEEQFYVALPILMVLLFVALRRFSEHTKLVVLAVVSTVGIVAALASYQVFQLSVSEFYYSSLTRSYQLLAGVALMAVGRRFGLRQDRRWLMAAGVVGLAVLGLVLELSVMWTGILATVFAGMCVASSQAVLVDNRWIERVGIWSYGIYLWHFPINEYLANERLHSSPWFVFAVTLAASTALSALTFRFLEDPIRHLKLPTGVTFAATAAVIAALFATLGLLATSTPAPIYADEPGEVDVRAALEVRPDGTVDLGSLAADGRLRASEVERVEGWMDVAGTAVGSCGLRDVHDSCIDLQGAPRVMLLGDSFANRIYQGLRPLAEENGWGLSAYVRPGCPWMRDVFNNIKNDISESCAKTKGDHLFEQVIDSVQPQIVVIHSYPYREANKRMTRASTGEVLSPEEVATAADETIDYLESKGAKVVFAEPTPYAADDTNVDDCLKLSTWADECDFDAIDVDSPLNRAMRQRAEDDPAVWFTSIDPLFCDELRCSSTLGKLAVMGDETHVSGGLWMKLRNVLLAPLAEAIDSL
ncbi:MAG: acyltransferase family protein [Acidimicrobiales bacterium]